MSISFFSTKCNLNRGNFIGPRTVPWTIEEIIIKKLKGARHGHNMTAKLDRLKKTEEEGIKRLEAVRKQQAERKAREDQTENTHELPLFEGEQGIGLEVF